MSDQNILHLLPGSTVNKSTMMVLELCNIPHKVQLHNIQSIKTPEYLSMNPEGKAPILETAQGPITMSGAIKRWAVRQSGKLGGKDEWEAAQVEQWYDWIRNALYTSGSKAMYSIFALMPKFNMDIGEFKKAVNEYLNIIQILEKHLEGRKFVVGDSVSIADCALVSDLTYMIRYVLNKKERARIPNVVAYYKFQANSENFVSRVRPYVENEKDMRLYHAPKKNNQQQKEPKKKAPKQKQKKAEKKPAKKEEPPKPKKPVFPDTKFDLHTFKTFFVNEKDKEKKMKHLWENYDEKAYSFWHLSYDKLEGECEKLYMTSNLMNGFIMRAEIMRKYVFGVHGIFGDEGNYNIRGVWMGRGTDKLPLIEEHVQNDVYKYRKLDINNEADRQLITDYWTKMEEDTISLPFIKVFLA